MPTNDGINHSYQKFHQKERGVGECNTSYLAHPNVRGSGFLAKDLIDVLKEMSAIYPKKATGHPQSTTLLEAPLKMRLLLLSN